MDRDNTSLVDRLVALAVVAGIAGIGLVAVAPVVAGAIVGCDCHRSCNQYSRGLRQKVGRPGLAVFDRRRDCSSLTLSAHSSSRDQRRGTLETTLSVGCKCSGSALPQTTASN